MIILDTNVISELMSPRPADVVQKWFRRQNPTSLYVTTITEAEMRAGIASMPLGRRRDSLRQAVDRILNVGFKGRNLVFDIPAAHAYATIFANRRAAGRAIGVLDCQIAAIAQSRGFSVATRDTYGFEGCGAPIINPWTAALS